MEPDDLKMVIMQLKTKNGHKIRQYYIDLAELLKMYVEYTLYFNHRESTRKITDLEQSMRFLGISLEEVKDQNNALQSDVGNIQRQLGLAVEDRVPLPVDEEKQERFVLLKRNDPEYMPYHTIRGQSIYAERKIKVNRNLFPNLEILLDLKANPNSKTLYVRIKDKLKAKKVLFDGNDIDLNGGITEDELMDEIKVIGDLKYEI
jgi:FtsZ-binding cell division protein ZapB